MPKMVQIGPAGRRGKGVKYNVQKTGHFSFFFMLFLPSFGEHIFESIAVFLALDDVFRWGLIS